jgi:HEAT repeat protein
MICERSAVPSIGVRTRRAAAVAAALLFGLSSPPARAQESFDDLVANLKSPTARTREEAARKLGESHRREAVAPVSALVRDPEPRVRLEVVKALCVLRDLSGVPALVTSLQDGDPTVREEAISALVEIYTERDRTGPVGRFLENFSDEYERSSVPPYTAVDPSVFRGLSGALKDEKSGIRADAAYAIGILGGGSSIPDLVAALKDPSGDARAAAATALGKCATAEEGRALIPLLADDNTTVRNRALQSIGVLRVHEAGPALREMFEQHKRRELGTRVLAALARTGDPAQTDLYRELLFSNDPDQRRLAVEGLARIADASMLPAFKTDFQREKNGDVRMAYAFGIVRLGDRAFLDSLVLALGGSGSSAQHARDLILEIGPSLAPDLYSYLGDRDPGVRGAVCDLLAQFGDTNAISKLQPLLTDSNSKVADRANRAIEKLRRSGSPAARP